MGDVEATVMRVEANGSFVMLFCNLLSSYLLGVSFRWYVFLERIES